MMDSFNKGGPGSGVKGHRTTKDKKPSKSLSLDKTKKIISNILNNDGFLSIGKNKWYEGDMNIFDMLFTKTIGMDSSKSRDKESKFPISDTTKANIKSMYEVNQAYLQDEYGETMTFYRGVNGNSFEKFKDVGVGGKVDLETYNISSWSSDEEVAKRFAKGSKKGVVVKVEVPTKSVLIHHDTFDVHSEYTDEKEVVLGGNKFNGEVISYHERKVVK